MLSILSPVPKPIPPSKTAVIWIAESIVADDDIIELYTITATTVSPFVGKFVPASFKV